MAREYTLTIGDVDYIGVTASAKNQFEALHICLRTNYVASFKDDLSDMAVVAAMAMVKFEDIQALLKLVVNGNIERKEDRVPVGDNLFGDDIQNYYLLLAKALKENLGNFSQLQRPTEKPKAVGKR